MDTKKKGFPGSMVLLAALVALTGTHGARAAKTVLADYVFRHGAVYTVSNEQPWAEAVAVSGNRIVYVGTEAGADAYVGKRTQLVDLRGGMLLPGFIDGHSHVYATETFLDAGLILRERPPADVIAALKRYVEAHPDERMIRGVGWIYEAFPESGPTRQMIDPFISDRPAVLKAIDGHHMWVNSKALQIAGITRDTPDPLPGKSWFQRDPQTGEPTGFIVEGAAMQLLRDRLTAKGYPFETRERLARGIEHGIPALAAAGITTLFDAGSPNQDETYELLHEMEKRGALTVRVYGSYRYRPDLKTLADVDPVQAFAALREKYHSEYLKTEMVKLFLDGTETNYTAYMLEPFSDKPETRGEPLIAPQALNELIQRLDAAGIDAHMHVVGDAGAREGLDAVEYAIRRNGSRDRRHTLAHTILVDPADIPRFRQLGVLWQSTEAWALMNDRNRTVRRLVGGQRFLGIYPFRAAIDQGAILVGGSDMTSLHEGAIWKPLDNFQIGHTRQPLDRPDVEIMPKAEQRLSIGELIQSYTINPAYMLRAESEIGSIAVGKKADLVVLERNLFDVPPNDIHKVEIRMTMMDGRPTYVQSQQR
ncbi:amidohydrolase [Solimonas flava]|uniref:amidohydrolase n=1 Tax=Solimonas flava TaxID=415849 RepID=UPI0003FFF42C|nr:amidohydrolase [Solimonas flava]